MTADQPHLHGASPSKPAPGRLRVVQAFVNSVDLESGSDDWRDPEALTAWLRHHGLLGPDDGVDADGLTTARRVREALRALLLVNNGAPPDESAARELASCTSGAQLRVRPGPDASSRLEPTSSGLDGALAHLLTIVHDASLAGTWPRLKTCRNDACGWAFYDSSKNRSGSWCSMRVCGSRMKSRAYRRRSQHGPGEPAGEA